jgi:selenide,water dikinase
MCRASNVSAEILPDRIPAISEDIFELIKRDSVPGGTRDNLKSAIANVDFGGTSAAQRVLLADAQTSGGLLLCVPEHSLKKVLSLLQTYCATQAIVGRIVRGRKKLICMTK